MSDGTDGGIRGDDAGDIGRTLTAERDEKETNRERKKKQEKEKRVTECVRGAWCSVRLFDVCWFDCSPMSGGVAVLFCLLCVTDCLTM